MAKKIMSVFLTTLLLAVCFLSAVPVSATTEEKYYSEAINTLASENFSTETDYTVISGQTDIASAYQTGKTSTGSGWGALWSTASAEYVAPASGTIKLNRVKLSSSASSSGAFRYFMQINKADLVAYRQFAKPLNFDAEGVIYEFSFDILEGFSDSNATSRRSFRFDVGGLFTIGHDRSTDGAQITPVIIIGEETVSSETSLDVSGGSTNSAAGELVTYTVRVELGATGSADKINLTVQENQELQIQNAWSKISNTIASVTKETNLAGDAGYIGFGSTAGKKMNFFFRNINIREIKSCEADEDCVATVNTSIMVGSVAFGKTISATIDVESKSENNANIIALAAIKNNNNLVGVACREAALTADAKTGTMALAYTFSEENGWDEASFDADEIGISFFVWNKDSLTPYINKVGFGTEAYD